MRSLSFAFTSRVLAAAKLSKMLRLIALACALACVGAVIATDTEDFIAAAQPSNEVHHIDKRGITHRLDTGSSPNGETVLSVSDVEVVNLSEQIGVRSQVITVEEGSELSFRGDTVSIINSTTGAVAQSFDNIAPGEFRHVATGLGPPLSLRTDPDVPAEGGGVLYVDADSAFFTDDDSINDYVEARRPFPPVSEPIIPVDFNVRRLNSGEVILNADPGGADDNVEPEDDIIVISGARCICIGTGESVDVVQGTIIIRRGSTPIEIIPNLEEFATYTGNPATLQRFSASDTVTRLRGSAKLYVGDNAGVPTAYFTDQADNVEFINNAAANLQLAFTGDSVTQTATVSTRPPDPEEELIELIGSWKYNLPNARQISFINNIFTVTGAGGTQLLRIKDLNGFSGYVNNEIIRDGTLSVPKGVCVYYNPSSGLIFAHEPNTVISNGIASAIQTANAPTAQPVRFTFSTTSTGCATLLANGQTVVSVTSGANFPVQPQHALRYCDGTIEAFEQSNPSEPINTFTDISQFTVNDGSTSLKVFNGSAPQTFSGPGRLYIDDDGLAFYTTSSRLPGSIAKFVAGIPTPRVTYTRETVEPGVVSVNITVGGTPVVKITDATSTVVDTDQVILYSGDTVNVADVTIVPDGVPVFYNRSLGFLYYLLNGEPVAFPASDFCFFDGQVILDQSDFPNDGTRVQVGTGGFVYSDGVNGSTVYSSTDTVTESFVTAVQKTGAIDPSLTDIDTLHFFDGQRLQIFSYSAPTVLPGGGTIYASANQTFYTTSESLVTDIPRRVAELVTTQLPYNKTTGIATVVSNGNNIYDFSPGGAATVSRFGPTVSIRYANGTINAPTISLQPFDVNSLTVFNGFESTVFGPDDDVTIDGPGLFIYDSITGDAFITTSTTVANSIAAGLTSIVRSFRAPIIFRPSQLSVVSKFPEVDAQFGQTIEVYDGADVSILCAVSNACPPATLQFFQVLTLMDNTTITTLIVPENDTMFDVIGDTLINQDIGTADSGVYRCVASNSVGSDSAGSIVDVRPAVAPEIVNNFIPFSPRPGELIVTAQNPAPAAINVSVNEVDQLVVACKGQGRPKATITWLVSIGGDTPMMINESSPNFDITVPRPGRSYINTTVNQVGCNTYFCNAENNAGEADGSVQVCAAEYTCQTQLGECSATCGVGFQREEFVDCTRSDGDTTVGVDLGDVPDSALPDLRVQLCVADQQQCPTVTFELVLSNFTECSVSCGCGFQTRTAECVRVETLNNVVLNETAANLTDCLTQSGVMAPVLRQDCNDFPCPFWLTGEISPPDAMCFDCLNDSCPLCEAECEFRHSFDCLTCMSDSCPNCIPDCLGCVVNCAREVSCIVQVTVDTNGTQIGDHFVNITDSEDLMDCRNITREDDLEETFSCEVEVDEENCNNVSRPRDFVQCNPNAQCPFQWRVDNFGECDADNCQVRRVFCGSTDPREPWEFDESLCTPEHRPHSVRDCDGGECSRGEWTTSVYSACSVTCGFGDQTRMVYCRDPVTGDRIEDGFCIRRIRPESRRRCIVRNCEGICDMEPTFCPFLAFNNLCKRITRLSQDCCRSCPLFATPITEPPTFPVTLGMPTNETIP